MMDSPQTAALLHAQALLALAEHMGLPRPQQCDTRYSDARTQRTAVPGVHRTPGTRKCHTIR